MITKNHPSAYAELFAKAKKALSEYGSSEKFKTAPMNNIDDYFACLAELARIENDYPDQIDPIFTILPATEETFYIDANKRTITIPENFAKYGVGVEGDEIAEILYFSIDRYFDAMDLAEMDIIVQWAAENDDISKNLSATYKRSLTLQPGRIVFGWPITSEITDHPGKINFSIRFYRRGVDENNNPILLYSFSTLTTTIKIQKGLDFSLTDETLLAAYNKNSQIYKNLRNSKKAEIGYVIAAPSFTGYFIETENENNEMVLVKTNPAKDEYNIPVIFVSKANVNPTTEDEYVSGAGLTYAWYKKVGTGDEKQDSIHLYVPVSTSDTYNPNEIYYEKKTEIDPENGTYEVYEPYYVTGDNNPFDDGVVLYTRHSKFEPATAGTYYSKATNTYTVGADKSIDSVTWVIPGAVPATFAYTSGLTATIEEDKGATLEINTTTESGETLTQWYYSLTENELDDAAPIAEATSNSCVAMAEGYYFIKATNTRNNDSLISTSNPIIATFDASEPVIINYYINDIVKNKDDTSYAAEINNTLKVEIGSLAYSEMIDYSWVKLTDEGDSIVASGSNTFIPTDNGNYQCIVKNTYKGKDKTSYSKIFKV